MQATTRPRDHGGLHYQGDKLILGEEDSSVAVDTGTGLTKTSHLLTAELLESPEFPTVTCLKKKEKAKGVALGREETRIEDPQLCRPCA
ncbi:Zinc finger protein 658B [Manis javanica]|nr:Zinc finger protein 658B [Manis javanica]